MARLGQLMLQGGKWEGKVIVPETWIAESIKVRFTPEQTKSKEGLGYGYLWWIPTSSTPAFRNANLEASRNLPCRQARSRRFQ